MDVGSVIQQLAWKLSRTIVQLLVLNTAASSYEIRKDGSPNSTCATSSVVTVDILSKLQATVTMVSPTPTVVKRHYFHLTAPL